MKVAILTKAYNEERLIKSCINQFKGFGMDHYIALSYTPWCGEPHEPDKTKEVAESLGATVFVSSPNKDEEYQVNKAIDKLQEMNKYDWILFVDADEYYTPQAIKSILKRLENEDHYKAFTCYKMLVYWKDQYHMVADWHTPPIMALRPTERFVRIRNMDCSTGEMPEDVILHHLCYVRTNEEVLKKIRSGSYAGEVISDWYEEKWLKWDQDNELTDLHTCQSILYPKAIKVDFPKELDRLFK